MKMGLSKLMQLRMKFNVFFSSYVLASAENEPTEECNATASPNNESASESGDSEANLNYSLSDDTYSDISNKSSPFYEVSVSALNELQNIDLTTDKTTGN